jgi:hypothetical protein
VLSGSFTRPDVAGANAFRLTGRLRNRRMSAGQYRLSASPTISIGTGNAAVVPFTVIG